MQKAWRNLALAAAASVVLLAVLVAREPLPEPLRHTAPEPSVRVLDRHRRLIAEVRRSDGARATAVSAAELPEDVVNAVLAAEDARFYSHIGVDPLAMGRALAQLVWHRRAVSGASTLTQQLARNVVPRPRTFAGKLREIVVALRIEAELDKKQILEHYLNRVSFGPNVRGIEAASRLYFDKPSRRLSLAEAATLAAIPRGPSLYDPARHPDRLRQRRDRILRRMQDRDLADPSAVRAALAQPLSVRASAAEGGAEHWASALVRGRLAPELSALGALSEIETTLDLGLQRELEALARNTRARMASHDGSAAAVVVIDNARGEVLGYVGSPDFFETTDLGQNDGVRALRQPGSTLKPFVYAAAIERLGLTAASLLPDLELHFPTPFGDFSPKNYDGRFQGPVRLRHALANSLNVPAVHVAHRLGAGHVLTVLHRFGFESLKRDAEHYGVALALGDGEVRLFELGQAYSTLSRAGLHRPLRVVRAVVPNGKARVTPAVAAPRQVLGSTTAELITDMLADPHARRAAFGADNVLELPFPAAVKTGTSKGYRDNWTVGYTREVTVAVWVGNFDGRPLRQSSGVTGAGPLFQDAMLAVMRDRVPAPLTAMTGLLSVAVCPLSGALPGLDCPHRVVEWFDGGRAPTARCAMHEQVWIDSRSGQRSAAGCTGAAASVVEAYPPEYQSWAESAGRPLAPRTAAAGCSEALAPSAIAAAEPSISFPYDGARFHVDPNLTLAQQQIVLEARAGRDARVTFVLDGQSVGTSRAPFALPWTLRPGVHRLEVRAANGARSAPVSFRVE